MRKISTTAELQAELQRLLNYVQTAQPSRAVLASRLSRLSERVAGHSYGVGNLSVVFTEGRKIVPFNSDVMREIDNTWYPVTSLEGDQTEGNLKFVDSDYGHGGLTHYEEQAGLRREIRVDIQYPVGPDERKSESAALLAIMGLGKRLGFSVRPSHPGYYPQKVQTKYKARPKRVSPFFKDYGKGIP